MDIISCKREFWQSLVVHIPKRLTHLIAFGFDTLCAQDIVSTRANARRSGVGWYTAKSKMGRLLKNKQVASVMARVCTNLSQITNDNVIAIDFSDFGDGRQVLMFAQQTHKGRAIPVYFEVLEYPIEKGSQNLFIIAAIEHFCAAVKCQPVLVFDRGFACPSIIHFLAQHKHSFIIRIKKRKFLANVTSGCTRAAESFENNDVSVRAYGHDLRLVVSDTPTNNNDPWYLITNATAASREDVITRYYHRFEIEEFFRDAKRLLAMEYLRFKTTCALTTTLWFVVLTAILFARLAATLSVAQEIERSCWRVSRFRYVLETLRRELWITANDKPFTLSLPFP